MAKDEAQYVRVQRTIWNKERFRGISEDAQKLLLYIVICPHGNMTGMFILRPGYAIEDLGWEQLPERFTKALGELVSSGHIKYDHKTKIVLDLNQIIKFPPQNPNQVTGAVSKLNELPFTPLFQDFKRLVKQLGKPLCKPLIEWLDERLGKYEDEDEDEKEAEESSEPLRPVDNSPQDETPDSQKNAFSSVKVKKEIQEAHNKVVNAYGLGSMAMINKLMGILSKDLRNGNKPAAEHALIHTFNRMIEERNKGEDHSDQYWQGIYKREMASYNAGISETEHEARKKDDIDLSKILKAMP